MDYEIVIDKKKLLKKQITFRKSLQPDGVNLDKKT